MSPRTRTRREYAKKLGAALKGGEPLGKLLIEIFEACGFRLRDELPMKRLDPQYRLLFGGGGEIRATGDVARMEAEIAAIAPGDAPKFRTFLSQNRSKLEAFRPILERPFGSWTALLDPSLLGALPWLRPTKSVDSDLSRYFADPRVRLAFSFQSKYLGMSPFRCPSLFTILSFLEYEHGVYHPIGGCNAVSDAMARCAERLGVKIRLGEPVEEIVFRGRRVVGVRTAAAEYASDSLVLNADFARALERLVPDGLRRRWTNRKIAEKKFSCSTFMLYLGIEGLRRPPSPQHLHRRGLPPEPRRDRAAMS